MIAVTIMNMAGPWLIRSLISTIQNSSGSINIMSISSSLDQITFLAVTILIIYILRAAAQFGTNYVSHYAAWYILEDIRTYLYGHLQQLSLKFFQDKQTGELMSRVINDTRNFERLLAHAIPTIVTNGFMLFGVSGLLFMMNARLALLTLIPIPLLAYMVVKFSKISRPLFREAQKEIGKVNSILQDNFSGIKEIKAFTQEKQEKKKTWQKIKNHTTAILKALKLSNAFHPSIEFVSSTGTVIVIFFGGRMALQGSMPMEDVVAFLLYLNLFYQPIKQLGRIYEGIQQALGSADRVLELLNEEPDIVEAENAVSLNKVKGDIEYKNVNFSYIDDIQILKDISFKIKSGQTLALVGPTGVGKTTIARLLPRFFDPDSGSIYIDNKDISTLNLTGLRKNISLVSQDIFLFNGTVKDNILYGRTNADKKEVRAAARAANAHEFIVELDNGYDTEIGERGVKLSGGQKQRISIARAVLKDAPILILDEATSSVDTRTELLIQEAMDKLKADKTTIIIAHRLSTIQDADLILVLKEGEIIERGTHEELIEEKGLYHNLSMAQSTTRDVSKEKTLRQEIS